MRAALVGTIVATCAAGVAAAAAVPAAADVKTGVDAWQQGDYARALAEWRPLAQAGDADAQFNLGQAYKLGRGVPVDLPMAIEWFRKAGAQGHERANDNYGLLTFQQGRREEAMPFIRKSAERGEPRAQYIMATAMFNGDLVQKDWVMAYALMTRAAASGLPQATSSLQVMDRYIATDQRQKGLSIAADMARTAKGPDYAAAPQPIAPAPVAAAPAPVRPAQPPRQVASATVPRSSSAAPPPTAAPPPATPTPRVSSAPRPAPAEPPPPTHWASGDDAPPPVREAPPAKPARAQPAKPPARAAAPPPAPAAAEKPSVSGNWRVQMGAFKEAPRARALWADATSRVSGLSGYKLYLAEGGGVTRTQAGPLASEADAARLCGRIRASGYTCIVKQN